MAIASVASFNAALFTAGTGGYSTSATAATGAVGNTIFGFVCCDAAGITPTLTGFTMLATSTIGPSIAVGVTQVGTAGTQTITGNKPAGVVSALFVCGYMLSGCNTTPDDIEFGQDTSGTTTVTAPSVTSTSSTSWSLSALVSGTGGGLVNSGTNIVPNPTGSVACAVANTANATAARWTLASAAPTGTRVTTMATAATNSAVSLSIAPSGTAQRTGYQGGLVVAQAVGRAATY